MVGGEREDLRELEKKGRRVVGGGERVEEEVVEEERERVRLSGENMMSRLRCG